MATLAERSADVYADPARERLGTSANFITLVRTVAAVGLAGAAAQRESLTVLVAALGVYWVGDVLDGTVARVRRCETRVGATLDILSDRLCAASFYLGLAWLVPGLAWPVMIYLTEFVVVDGFLSLAFLAWPIRSPNYFYVVDRRIWVWNWSVAAKAVNSSIFAVLLLLTGSVVLGVVVASALLVLKSLSVVRLLRLGVPVPSR